MGLFKTKIKSHEELVASHQSFYNGEFEVLQMERKSFWDIFPLNLLIAYAEAPFPGEWKGIISTNGEKIIITQSKKMNATKHKKVFEFLVEDIDSYDRKWNEKFMFKNKISGLTQTNVNYFLKYPIFICTIGACLFISPFAHMFHNGRLLNLKYKDEFGNEEKFLKLLNKLTQRYKKWMIANKLEM